MKNFSFLWCVINLILFVVYVLVSMFVAGLIYGAVAGGQTDPSVQEKIGYLVILLVLIFTVILRKGFYKSVWTEKQEPVTQEPKKSYTASVKEKVKKEWKSKMKIYVDKEIK